MSPGRTSLDPIERISLFLALILAFAGGFFVVPWNFTATQPTIVGECVHEQVRFREGEVPKGVEVVNEPPPPGPCYLAEWDALPQLEARVGYDRWCDIGETCVLTTAEAFEERLPGINAICYTNK